MKKKILIVLTLFVLLFTCSCKKDDNIKVLKCSAMTKGNNMNIYSDIEYKFVDNKLSRFIMDATFKDIEIQNLSSIWDSIKTQFTEQNAPVSEKGFKRTVKSDDKNYTFTVSLDVDFEKIPDEVKDKYEVTYDNNMTYEEVLKKTTEDGTVTCR